MEKIKELESALTKDIARMIFVSQLSGRIKATCMLAHIVSLVLEKHKA